MKNTILLRTFLLISLCLTLSAVRAQNAANALRSCSDTTVNTFHANCLGDSFLFGTRYLKLAGLYADTLPRVGGCDSIINLDLGISPPPTVTFTWDSLAQEDYLMLESHTVAGWCELFYPRLVVPLVGGTPPGGVYSGDLVTNDTLNLSTFSYAVNYVDSIFYTYTDNNNCSATVLDSIVPVFCDGIQTIPVSGSISLYPNPNKGSFTLTIDNSQLTSNFYIISDMLGHIIAQQPITSSTQQIEIPHMAEGVYTLSVRGMLPVRFVVMK